MIRRLLTVAVFACAFAAQPAEAGPASDTLRRHAAAGTLAQAETELVGVRDDEGVYALGAAQFLRAFEKFGQSLYRHGFAPSDFGGRMAMFQMPGTQNPSPQPLTYTQLRGYVATFVDDLDRASTTLARVDSARVKLIVDVTQLRFDVDGDGRADPQDPDGTPAPMTIHFDRADAFWLRGYANLFAAQGDFVLAHNFETTFSDTFHLLFPRAGLPMTHVPHANPDPSSGMLSTSNTAFADAIALIHLINWEVVEPQRRARVRTRLLETAQLSRQTLADVQRERDDDHEWLPGPRQSSAIETNIGMNVTAQHLAAWGRTTRLIEDVLNGRKLVPHWRFQQGLDMRAFFERPQRFDLVLMLTGSGAVPYLRDGDKVTTAEITELRDALGPNALLFAAWFN